jgi:hypothetical protein
MFDDLNYAALLRPIGQMLESLRIESFAVRPDEDSFVVRDQTRNRVQLTPRERTFLAELHWSHADSLDKSDARRLAAGVFEWHVTRSDVERFEREGREKRRAEDQTPDTHAVSQMLRVIGSILDQKGGRMAAVSKDEQVVTLEYELSGGRRIIEEYNVPTLYDFWVRMYMKRAARNGEARLTA